MTGASSPGPHTRGRPMADRDLGDANTARTDSSPGSFPFGRSLLTAVAEAIAGVGVTFRTGHQHSPGQAPLIQIGIAVYAATIPGIIELVRRFRRGGAGPGTAISP